MGAKFRFCSDEYFECADHTLIFTHGAIEEHLDAAGFEPYKSVARICPTPSADGSRPRPR
jgi:hypothetical protein